MTKVCEDLYPLGSFPNQKSDGFYVNKDLKANIDILLKNASKKDDWDFVILITGGGRVRIGKSVLAMQIAKYWVYMLKELYGIDTPFNLEENIVFHGDKLIEKGHALFKKYSQGVIDFDEAGADLEGLKVMRRATQNVRDYLRECGQYNFLTIIVLPEFFDLPKGIAMTRSDCLIDVYRAVDKNGKFVRGFFNFYSWPNKKQLYIRGKKELNYKAFHYDFHGDFFKFYPIDEEKYKKDKLKAILSRKKEDVESKWKIQRDILLKMLVENGFTQQNIADYMNSYGIELTRQSISTQLMHLSKKLALQIA